MIFPNMYYQPGLFLNHYFFTLVFFGRLIMPKYILNLHICKKPWEGAYTCLFLASSICFSNFLYKSVLSNLFGSQSLWVLSFYL